MKMSTGIVVAVVGTGVHILLSFLSQYEMPWSNTLKGIIYGVTPIVVSFLLIAYMAWKNAPIIRTIVIALLGVTGMFVFICVSVIVQGGVLAWFTPWKIIQFWLVTLLIWSPICLSFSAAVQMILAKPVHVPNQ